MASGTVYQDLLPIPAEDPTKIDDTTPTMMDKPTESHALAMEATKSPEELGAAQETHEEEVMNLGWNEPKEQVASPLVGGLDNEELWMLVRRFNKVRAFKIKKTAKWSSDIPFSKCTTSRKSQLPRRVV